MRSRHLEERAGQELGGVDVCLRGESAVRQAEAGFDDNEWQGCKQAGAHKQVASDHGGPQRQGDQEAQGVGKPPIHASCLAHSSNRIKQGPE